VPYRTRYIPANTRAQHDRARARYGIPPSTNESMKEKLVSPEVQKASLEAAEVIAQVARGLAAAELTSKEKTGAYEASIEAVITEPKEIGGNLRAAAAVTAHGGYEHWTGPIGAETSHAAVVEFDVPEGSDAGPRPRQGRRILGRAGAAFDSPGTPA
jgi:hypothetical protein